MARSRNIKPGFFSNEHLAELDFATRLLFIGMWTEADREGRRELRDGRFAGGQSFDDSAARGVGQRAEQQVEVRAGPGRRDT